LTQQKNKTHYGKFKSKIVKVLNVILWIAQLLLAGMFLMAGFMKLTTPVDQTRSGYAIVPQFRSLVKFIGVSEVAGALGLLHPFPSSHQARTHRVGRQGSHTCDDSCASLSMCREVNSRPLVQTSSSFDRIFYLLGQVKRKQSSMLAHKTARKSDPVSKSD